MNATQRKMFGQRIRILREAKGISQTHMATLLRVCNSYLNHLEAGRRVPSVALLYRIAGRLGGTPGGYLP